MEVIEVDHFNVIKKIPYIQQKRPPLGPRKKSSEYIKLKENY